MQPDKNYFICGANSGIGLALTSEILNSYSPKRIFATYRPTSETQELFELQHKHPDRLETLCIDVTNEENFYKTCSVVQSTVSHLDVLLNCVGVLQDEDKGLYPERKIEEFKAENFHRSIAVNATPTLLLAHYFKNLMLKSDDPIFASLSAKVGSLSDNRLGGWYSYRISKAALNMALKNISIEFSRKNKRSLVISLHPGTTETKLSQPFLDSARKKYQIHRSQETARNLLKVLASLDPEQHNGGFYSWDGSSLPW